MLLQATDVARLEVDVAREEREAAVAGHDVDRRDAVAARETPRDRVLATAAAEHEAVETRSAERSTGTALLALLLDDLLHALAALEVVPDLLQRHSHSIVAGGFDEMS